MAVCLRRGRVPSIHATWHGGMCQGTGSTLGYWKSMRSQVIAIRGRSEREWFSSPHFQKIEVRGKKSSSLTSVTKDNMIMEMYEATSST